MKKRRLESILLSLTLAAAFIGFAYADEITVCPEESPAATIAAAQAAVNMKSMKPELKAASHSYNKIKLSWDAVSGAGGYEVCRATSKTGKFQKVSAIAAEKTSYINTGLTCGKTYWYKLRAYQLKSGKKVYSKYSDVKSTYPKPSKAKNVKVKFTVGGVSTFDLDWDKVSGASGYQLQFKAGNGKWSTYEREYNDFMKKWENTYPDEYKGSKYLYNVKYIKYGTKAYWALNYSEDSYSFRVRAYKTVNGKKVFGLYSEPTTIKPVWKSRKELQDFVHTWVDENYPTYDRAEAEEYAKHATPENGTSWGTTWTWCLISKYTSKEYMLEKFCKGKLKTYFGSWWNLAEETRGILYTRDLGNGDYQVWWLG